MVELERQGYFHETSIRQRAPGLFHELIGRFLNGRGFATPRAGGDDGHAREGAQTCTPAPNTRTDDVKSDENPAGKDEKVSQEKGAAPAADRGSDGTKSDENACGEAPDALGGYAVGHSGLAGAKGKHKLSMYLLDRCHEKGGFDSGGLQRPLARENESGNTKASLARGKGLRPGEEDVFHGEQRDMDIGRWYAGEFDAKEASERDRKHLLMSLMRERFLQGREPGIDYGVIDSNESLDDYAELARDAEEKWFDEQSWD